MCIRDRANVEEAPAVPARHVLHLHAAEGRQVGDHPIELQERFVELHAPMTLTEILAQLIENAPRVDRKAVTHVRGNAPQVLERLPQACAGTLPEERRQKLLLELSYGHATAR